MRSLLDVVVSSYSGDNLLDFIYLINDLKCMPNIAKVRESREGLKSHLIEHNVLPTAAHVFVFGEFPEKD